MIVQTEVHMAECLLTARSCRDRINTLMMVLADQLKDWEPGSLEILVSAADEHMTEIEDVFLASTSVNDDAEETVPFSSLRKDLEI